MSGNDKATDKPRTLTEVIIGCAIKVHNTLGVGFLEKVYENALVHELRKAGLKAEQQVPLSVFYDDIAVGNFFADILVESKVILELKVAIRLNDEHSAICMNYLRASKHPVCLLFNFGTPRLEIKRHVGASYIDYKEPL